MQGLSDFFFYTFVTKIMHGVQYFFNSNDLTSQDIFKFAFTIFLLLHRKSMKGSKGLYDRLQKCSTDISTV